MNQRQNATECMIEWLSHKNELGKAPFKIEIAGEFDLHNLHYYIFKFKKSRFSPWLVGVCGGYEGENVGHCGHIFSELKEYHEETAQQACINMVEMIREYWMKEAKKHEVPQQRTTFVHFVLLKDSQVNLMQVFDTLKEHIEFENIEKNDKQIYVTSTNHALISLSLMDIPVPEGEAEYYAQGCYMWEDAVKEVHQHQAHIIVSTMGQDATALECMLIQSQFIDACLHLEKAIAVYGDEIVWPKHIYCDIMKDYYDEQVLPIFLWVYLGFITNQDGNHIYTLGLKNFGHYEIETLPSNLPLDQLHNFIYNVVCYIIEQKAVLHDGETIGMSATQKCQISLSSGLFIDEDTLKIEVIEE